MRFLVLFAMLLMPASEAATAAASPSSLVFYDDFELTRSTPAYYDRALRNPMKGFTHSIGHPWASTQHVYFRWNELENAESDGLDRILQVSQQRFANGPASNVKFIPRVYLHWSTDAQKYWPQDMQTDDYTSPQFQARVTRLVQRLGQAWNDDPRVAFVELGIFGKWGEHHSPSPTPEMQQMVGQAFRDAFPDKKVSVRHAWSEFQGLGKGAYWDSWGHYQQMWGHGRRIAELNRDQQLYLQTYIGGEVAYDWGEWRTQPGLVWRCRGVPLVASDDSIPAGAHGEPRASCSSAEPWRSSSHVQPVCIDRLALDCARQPPMLRCSHGALLDALQESTAVARLHGLSSARHELGGGHAQGAPLPAVVHAPEIGPVVATALPRRVLPGQ